MRAPDEAGLARRAARGDGQAFAELYDQYESRIFNFCLRLVGNRDDAADATQDAFVKVLQRLPSIPAERELNFGAYLFTAARNASYDVIGKRKRADAVDEIPERGARPLMGDEVGDVLEDPERAALLGSFQTAVQQANARLPERQREVLALRELDDLSYDEIAEIMDMNRNSVAQLISRARIKLRDELRGSALASVAVSSPACERALPLIAKRQDGQLKDDADAAWLDDHIGDCATCQVSVEAMAEAGLSYRAWAPVIPMAWLWKATAAHAMERTGHDWSELLDRDRSHVHGDGTPGGAGAGVGGAAGGAAGAEAATAVLAADAEAGDDAEPGEGHGRRRRAAALLGALLLLLLFGGTILATADDTTPVTLDPAQPASLVAAAQGATTTTTGTTTTPAPAAATSGSTRRKGARKKAGRPLTLADLVAPTAASTPAATTTQAVIPPAAPARPRRPRPRPAGAKGTGGGSKVTGSVTPNRPVSTPPASTPPASTPPASTPPASDPTPPPAADPTPPPATDPTPPPATTTSTTTTTPPPTTTSTTPTCTTRIC